MKVTVTVIVIVILLSGSSREGQTVRGYASTLLHDEASFSVGERHLEDQPRDLQAKL